MLFNKNDQNISPEIEEKLKSYRRQGHIVPPRKIIKNAEQIEGIRESAKINTAVLDHVAANICVGMSTDDINTLVYDFTVAHGANPSPVELRGIPEKRVHVDQRGSLSRHPEQRHYPARRRYYQRGRIHHL